MRTIEIKVYTIDEHPNPEKCYEWIRENWYDLGQHSVDDVVGSLKALREEIGGKLDYSICQVADRGEFITLKDYDEDKLKGLDADKLPLTGVCWDYDVIQGMKDGNPEMVLESLHNETEYTYSDEGLYELCMGNEYEFNEDGEVI